MKKALICGVSGQDGAYLAQLLLGQGYQVWGSSRDAQVAHFSNLARLGIKDRVNLDSVSLIDFRSVLQALMKIQPDEIYNLAGQTSVIALGKADPSKAEKELGSPGEIQNERGGADDGAGGIGGECRGKIYLSKWTKVLGQSTTKKRRARRKKKREKANRHRSIISFFVLFVSSWFHLSVKEILSTNLIRSAQDWYKRFTQSSPSADAKPAKKRH